MKHIAIFVQLFRLIESPRYLGRTFPFLQIDYETPPFGVITNCLERPYKKINSIYQYQQPIIDTQNKSHKETFISKCTIHLITRVGDEQRQLQASLLLAPNAFPLGGPNSPVRLLGDRRGAKKYFSSTTSGFACPACQFIRPTNTFLLASTTVSQKVWPQTPDQPWKGFHQVLFVCE